MLSRFATTLEEQTKAYIGAVVAFILYIALAYNWVCITSVGGAGYAYTSASLSGFVQIIWFLLPAVWLTICFKYGNLWFKTIAVTGLIFVCISTVATTAFLFQSIVRNVDVYRATIDISKLDSRSNECLYRVSPCFPYGIGRIGCVETKMMPGIIYIKIRERASLDDFWQPLIQYERR